MVFWTALGAARAGSSSTILGQRIRPDQLGPVDPEALPNFFQVDQGLFRGAQPSRQGLAHLKELGVRTIINLRGDSEWEQDWVTSLGLSYISLPVDSFKRIPRQTVERFLSVVTDPAQQPVFIHCRRGADRTGVLVGIYRMKLQGWSPRRTLDELRRRRHHWYFSDLRGTLADYDDTHSGIFTEQGFIKSLGSRALKSLAQGALQIHPTTELRP